MKVKWGKGKTWFAVLYKSVPRSFSSPSSRYQDLVASLDSLKLPLSLDSLEAAAAFCCCSCVTAIGLYSVITTVTLLTVTSLVCAELLSTFFSLGGWDWWSRLELLLAVEEALLPLEWRCLWWWWWWWERLTEPPADAGEVESFPPGAAAVADAGPACCWAAASAGFIRGLRVEVPGDNRNEEIDKLKDR